MAARYSKRHRRALTPEEREDAKRLRAVWERQKRKLGLTQEGVAHACGWRNQSAFNQYLTERIPLGLDAMLKLAEVLEVSPAEISPRLTRQLSPVLGALENIADTTGQYVPYPRVPLVTWELAGRWPEVDDPRSVEAEAWVPCPVRCGPRAFALRVTGVSMDWPAGGQSFRDGETIYADPAVDPQPGAYVIARRKGTKGAVFRQLIEEGGEQFLKALNPAFPEPITKLDKDTEIVAAVLGKWAPT